MKLYKADFFGKPMWTPDLELYEFLGRCGCPEELRQSFPGLFEAALRAMTEVEGEHFSVDSLVHRRGRVQARAGRTIVLKASQWVPIKAPK